MSSENGNKWVFRLFVSGKTPKTGHTVELLEQICKKYLGGKCDIRVIDINENPRASIEENIIATPTLIKKKPEPFRRIIGDVLDEDKLLSVLEIIK